MLTSSKAVSSTVAMRASGRPRSNANKPASSWLPKQNPKNQSKHGGQKGTSTVRPYCRVSHKLFVRLAQVQTPPTQISSAMPFPIAWNGSWNDFSEGICQLPPDDEAPKKNLAVAQMLSIPSKSIFSWQETVELIIVGDLPPSGTTVQTSHF